MKKISVLFLVISFFSSIFINPTNVFAAATQVDLLTAQSFAVLAGSGITNTGPTTINGDVGSFPTTTQTGFGSVTINGTNHAGDSVTQGAKTDLNTAYDNAAGQGPTNPIVADLGGQTLTAGVYNSASSIGLTGNLTLNAQGDPNAVFIFQAGSTLTTAGASSITLTNGAQACNVFWQLGSSATLGTNSSFVGTIIALADITVTTGVTVNGRVLARDGAVTLDNNTITVPTCAAGTSGGTSLPVSNSIAPAGSAPVRLCPTIIPGVIPPSVISSRRTSSTSIFLTWGPYSGTDRFNIRYGTTSGNWLYNTDVTGFSTTLNSLPANSSIWVQIAARNDCQLGEYGEAGILPDTTSSSIGLPKAGFPTEDNKIFYSILSGAILGVLILSISILRKS